MEKEPGYVLVRDMHASIRLNLQHYFWKDGLGYLLHPSIPPPPPRPKYRVADLGTGTGIWPLDLARRLPPTAQLCGFDISSAQFPPSQLPTLEREIRIDPNRGIAEGPNGEEAPHVAKVLNVQANIKDHRWVPALPKLFARYDLEGIKEDFAFEQPWQSKMVGDGSCAVVHEMASNGSRFVMEKLERVGVNVPKAYEEVCRGTRLTQPFCVTVGRKPIKMSV
ncbi:uncharacterized protein EAE97_008426 [Botrytis byssoidea]|uniref:Methyltransferase domain-containing protein n=1 Tax=Botrytis byssoidea TaxID=139641 RepID=A0A9P5IDZ5_9HELO|nr:uncharacterized protein EAE97_008426 [Botrytis byssoidea]KAF7934066.1 hypothetical protein EAE97_008426 [Botrytis byssoidea]